MNAKELVKSSSIYCFLKRVFFRCRTWLVPKPCYAVVSYWMKYRKYLDVKHPKTFDEKLWWLKFNYHNPLQTLCADKWRVREYVIECGLEDILIDCFGHFSSLDEIDLSQIPADEFFLKCNHLSGGNMIIRKGYTDWKKVHSQFGHWLKDNAYYYGFEWPYKNMKPCLVAERVLHTDDTNGLLDYKFFCFKGEPKILSLDIGVCNEDGSHAKSYYRNFYDLDFCPLEIKETREHYDYNKIEKPENFQKMIEYARRLSAPFPHCRVDLYNVKGKIYFGEITFYHGSGYNDFQPDEASLQLGSWIDIECYNNICIEHSKDFPYQERRRSLNRK